MPWHHRHHFEKLGSQQILNFACLSTQVPHSLNSLFDGPILEISAKDTGNNTTCDC